MPDNSPSAVELQRAWFDNMIRLEKCSRQDVVNRLLNDLRQEVPATFCQLFGWQFYQVLKKPMIEAYYPSILVFVWQKALQETHPAEMDRLLSLFESTYLRHQPNAKPHLQTIARHLSLFAVVTDNFTEDGFMSVALHIVQRICGEIEKKPDNLQFAVQLALHMDTHFEAYKDQLGNQEIHPS